MQLHIDYQHLAHHFAAGSRVINDDYDGCPIANIRTHVTFNAVFVWLSLETARDCHPLARKFLGRHLEFLFGNAIIDTFFGVFREFMLDFGWGLRVVLVLENVQLLYRLPIPFIPIHDPLKSFSYCEDANLWKMVSTTRATDDNCCMGKGPRLYVLVIHTGDFLTS